MKHVIRVDLGTSAVKILPVNQNGDVVQEVSKAYPLIHEKAGYSEQDPQLWVDQTVSGLSDLLEDFKGNRKEIEGISLFGTNAWACFIGRKKCCLAQCDFME